MSKRSIKYTIAILVVLFLGYHSVYFRKLDEVKAAVTGNFDASGYTAKFWKEKLIPNLGKAMELDTLITALKAQPEEAFKQNSHSLGIGNIKYFMVRGEAEVLAVKENSTLLKIKGNNSKEVELVTEYVYGNEVRDASGLIPMTEFDNTMDFNSVSAAINKTIREKVIPPFKEKVKKGSVVKFFGAIELNQKYLDLSKIQLIPIQLEIKN